MNCLTCGKPIVGRRPDAKYCSRDCQRRRKYTYQLKESLMDTPWERWFKEECEKACKTLRNSKKKGETK